MTKSVALIRANNGTNRASSPVITSARSIGATTILVNTVAGLPSYFIAEMGTPNLTTGLIANGVVFRGHLNSGQIVIDQFATGYVDAGSAANDIIVLKPTAEWSNNIADILSTFLNDDGTFNSTALGTILNAGLTAQNLRYQPRLATAASAATLTPNVDNQNYYRYTALAANLTIANHTGTPLDGEGLLIDITDNGTSRTLTWGTDYTVNSIYGLTLPTATVTGKRHFITFVWDSTLSKYVAVL
ncbi:MAG TPA: hypothetical protein VN081_02265 [Dongiaceae bacterium]|nr:hypothetical protein [Dongiaceae bacterium]